jgi:hypothetical protein
MKQYLDVPELTEIEMAIPSLEEMAEGLVHSEEQKSLLLQSLAEKYTKKEAKRAMKERQRLEKLERKLRQMESVEKAGLEKCHNLQHLLREQAEMWALKSRNWGSGMIIPPTIGYMKRPDPIPPFCKACKRHHW